MNRGEILRLRRAIDNMAGRYGITCMDVAYAEPGPERARLDRAASRQYAALLRLTDALARIAAGRC